MYVYDGFHPLNPYICLEDADKLDIRTSWQFFCDISFSMEDYLMINVNELGKRAKEASAIMNTLGVADKNRGLLAAANALIAQTDYILAENEKDVQAGIQKQMSKGLLDRLKLIPQRIEAMAEGLRDIVSLEDPVGEVISMKTRPNGLIIGQKRVPLGVIGIIYESRPNVTADAFGLCFKAGNAVILKGGSDAIYSNTAISKVLRSALKEENLPEDALCFCEDTARETTTALMQLREYIDVLIPRGGAGLIQAVVKNSTIPVIETGTGNCHIYIDESADLDMAISIIINAKTQRVGVCNACESLVIHEKVLEKVMPPLAKALQEKNVEIRGDQKACLAADGLVEANEEDWGTEYLDYIVSVKTVSSIEEAIAHINRYNTGHSESIITSDYANAQKFLNEIDAAAVYVNASTRFTDGAEFGFGAEIGISTQKLHARGPMGLKELTTTKYIVYGNGQVRP
jgi:glutamate-5-semialdehyde dehydrogenase